MLLFAISHAPIRCKGFLYRQSMWLLSAQHLDAQHMNQALRMTVDI